MTRALRTELDDRAAAALERIEGADRRLLAVRSYLRAGPDLAARWTWSDEAVAAYRGSPAHRDALAEVEKVVAAFAAANPGYTLYVNTEVRSLGVQLARWNENASVAAAAAELRAAALVELAAPDYADGARPVALAKFRAFLVGWRPSAPVALAAPGLSPHGQLRAFDFQVQQGDRIVASTRSADVAAEWDAPGWTGKLGRAVASASSRLQGPLETPREPWHYAYSPAQVELADLRERLTEREDRRRPLEPFHVEVAGRPLVLGGEYELALGGIRRRILDPEVEQQGRLLLEQGLTLEAFYSFGLPLSIFVQGVVGWEKDLLPDTFEEVSDVFVERGETWLHSEDIAGSGISVELGSLDFEDDRRWWWDDELDGARVRYETETFEVALAAAQELGSRRSDRDDIEPEVEDVRRLVGEASWDWSPNQSLQLFLLHQDDHSHDEDPREVVLLEVEDDSDARLTWLGARGLGVVELGARGLLGYWLDAAYVRGSERLVDYEQISSRASEVTAVVHRDVRGWGVDAGLSWMLPLALEPRLFVGYAFGSGDRDPDADTDRSFRQTGLHSNEAGFGGVQRFPHYGLLLAPELSNLGIVTVGAGFSLLRASSLDLVYHHYHLAQPAALLFDAQLEGELDGAQRGIGQEVDLVLAVEESERFEFDVGAAAFRRGSAWADRDAAWSCGGFLALRIAF